MESTPHKCKICKKSFGDNYTLSLHEKTHGEKPYKCPATGCTKAFPSASRLKEHSKVHNPTTSNFHCQYKCGKVFAQKKNCIQHEEHCPQGPKKPKIQCPYCSKEIQRLTDLKRHAKKKHPSRVSDGGCGTSPSGTGWWGWQWQWRQRQWRQRVGSASLSDVNLLSAMFYTARRPLLDAQRTFCLGEWCISLSDHIYG